MTDELLMDAAVLTMQHMFLAFSGQELPAERATMLIRQTAADITAARAAGLEHSLEHEGGEGPGDNDGRSGPRPGPISSAVETHKHREEGSS